MTLLIVIDRMPYGDWRGRELIDMAFSLAAFDQPVSLLFRGAGVNWLRPDQNPGDLEQKSVARNLAAAPVFGVSEILADKAGVERYQLTPDQLVAAARVTAIEPGLYRQFDHIVAL